jgi:hypothetical protein
VALNIIHAANLSAWRLKREEKRIGAEEQIVVRATQH